MGMRILTDGLQALAAAFGAIVDCIGKDIQ